MKSIIFCVMVLILCCAAPVIAQEKFEQDTVKTSGGDLQITFIGHGSLIFQYQHHHIYIDPFSQLADYAAFPKADIIFLTHHHRDHLDTAAINLVRTDKTEFVLTPECARQLQTGIIMKNGDIKEIKGIKVEAVPAYNLVHKRDNGQLFHPKGEGNGYLLTFGDKRVFVAGDTENTPEMKALKNIDYAFLPMNLPYTMTPEMVADAAGSFNPGVLYPYHYGETDTAGIITLLKDNKNIEIRIRNMK